MSILTATQELLSNGRICRVRVHRGSNWVTFGEVLRGWADGDGAARRFSLDLLAGLPFRAFRFEAPAIRADTIEPAFEFVAVDEPALERRAAPRSFAEAFGQAPPGRLVLAIPNLGGDAMMVVPTLAAAGGHLAAFIRGAPDAARHALLRVAAETTLAWLGPAPLWLNTAGMGVPWLHVRIDSRPKYYAYRAYAGTA